MKNLIGLELGWILGAGHVQSQVVRNSLIETMNISKNLIWHGTDYNIKIIN